jgi:beta-xylosidase
MDTNGRPIEAHTGGVLFEDGVYYWYGMNWDGPTILPNSLPRQAFSWFVNRGITVYSSRDLVTWKHQSTVLADVSYDPASLLQPLNGLIRPKVIKNDATGKYVLMAALTCPDFETYNDVVVAVADAPTGPFTLLGKLGWRGTPNRTGLWTRVWDAAAADPPTRIRGFDMTLYKDTDGKAYLVTAHADVCIHQLSDDYLSVVDVRLMENVEGEAPALFHTHGMYYCVTSRLTGWAPNQNTYCTAPTLHGPWRPRGPFALGARAQTTFDSQVTFVLPLAHTPHTFIFLADRFGAVTDLLVPDMRQAVHVWLPIILDPQTQSMQVQWLDEWDPSAF